MEEVYYGGWLRKQITLKPDKAFKGKPAASVLTALDSDQCGAIAKPGLIVLIYAWIWEGQLWTNVFNTMEWDEDSERALWLERRKAAKPSGQVPGERAITVYDQGRLHIYRNRQPLDIDFVPFIHDHSVYVPHRFFSDTMGYDAAWAPDQNRIDIRSVQVRTPRRAERPNATVPSSSLTQPRIMTVRYHEIGIWMDGNKLADIPPEPFVFGGEVYVPLRAVSERLGWDVAWEDRFPAVFLDARSLFEKGETPRLLMKFSVEFGMGADYLVDELTENTATVRDFDYQHSAEPEKTQRTVPFADMMKKKEGVQEHVIRLFLATDTREAELKVSAALMENLIQNPNFRKRLGARLGQPLERWPEDLLFDMEDLEAGNGR